jgi:hypothetical protein
MAFQFQPNDLVKEIYRLHPEIKWLDNQEYRRIKWFIENKGMSVSEATVHVTADRPREKYRAVPDNSAASSEAN